VHATAGGVRGLGYTYADVAAAKLVQAKLAAVVTGMDALDVTAANGALRRAVRNLSRRGLAAYAISAVDAALWDLKAKLLGVSLSRLLGAVRDGVPGYGSGGFTSYDVERLQRQLAGWVEEGFRRVKMKIGRDPAEDDRRVAAAREAIGTGPELFVDANGAYAAKEALGRGRRGDRGHLGGGGVLLRDRAPRRPDRGGEAARPRLHAQRRRGDRPAPAPEGPPCPVRTRRPRRNARPVLQWRGAATRAPGGWTRGGPPSGVRPVTRLRGDAERRAASLNHSAAPRRTEPQSPGTAPPSARWTGRPRDRADRRAPARGPGSKALRQASTPTRPATRPSSLRCCPVPFPSRRPLREAHDPC